MSRLRARESTELFFACSMAVIDILIVSLQSEMKDLGTISKIALTTLFGLAVFCFWMFVRPALVVEREALQLFLWNSDYLMSRLVIPGGLARYVAEFMVQYFMFEAWGACMIAVMLFLVQWLTWVLLRRCLPAVKEYLSFAVSFLPSVALWYLLCDMDTSMTLPVALVLTLLLLLLLPPKRNSSLLGSFALVPIGYWIAGPIALLVAVYHLRWLRPPLKKIRVLAESMVMALLLGVCILVSSYFVPYSLSNMAKGIDYFSIQCGKIGTLEMIEYDYLQRNLAWGKVLEKANKEEPKAKACQHIVSLAKYYQKQISPEELKSSLYQPYKALTSATSAMMMSDLFFHMGFVNFSQRAIFEAMESASNYNKSGRALCRLTETAMVTGQYEVALKYISLLEETLFYKRWAKYMRQLVDHPESIKDHPKYGPLQKIYSETEDMLFI